ncbi:hypothetical protein FSP39_002439 [Pinctada imbricata]|uniref:Uncharacterized protein n=1 Tax=Pinctada imbricata TaxID=66713 RepID=A0AA89BNC3_PINIB|nr:hypothetical protein FSP39_002439 [Pinctada imbricata]
MTCKIDKCKSNGENVNGAVKIETLTTAHVRRIVRAVAANVEIVVNVLPAVHVPDVNPADHVQVHVDVESDVLGRKHANVPTVHARNKRLDDQKI